MNGYLTVEDVSAYIGLPTSAARRVLARCGPVTEDQFKRWLDAHASGEDILKSTVPVPGPERAPIPLKECIKGRVYFIEAVGAERVKIGFTRGSAASRLRHLRTSCPFPLRVLGWTAGTMGTESRFHERFESARVMPKLEWFHYTKELRRFIAMVSDRTAKPSGAA